MAQYNNAIRRINTMIAAEPIGYCNLPDFTFDRKVIDYDQGKIVLRVSSMHNNNLFVDSTSYNNLYLIRVPIKDIDEDSLRMIADNLAEHNNFKGDITSFCVRTCAVPCLKQGYCNRFERKECTFCHFNADNNINKQKFNQYSNMNSSDQNGFKKHLNKRASPIPPLSSNTILPDGTAQVASVQNQQNNVANIQSTNTAAKAASVSTSKEQNTGKTNKAVANNLSTGLSYKDVLLAGKKPVAAANTATTTVNEQLNGSTSSLQGGWSGSDHDDLNGFEFNNGNNDHNGNNDNHGNIKRNTNDNTNGNGKNKSTSTDLDTIIRDTACRIQDGLNTKRQLLEDIAATIVSDINKYNTSNFDTDDERIKHGRELIRSINKVTKDFDSNLTELEEMTQKFKKFSELIKLVENNK